MKKEIQIEAVGKITYEESLISGKKDIYVNDVKAQKLGKTLYTYNEKSFTIIGNVLQGVNIIYNSNKYVVIEKTKWYEYLLAALAFLFVIIWGNVPQLVAVFPIIGGAIGGGISGAMAIVNIVIMKKIQNTILKVLISLIITIGTILILFVLAITLLTSLA